MKVFLCTDARGGTAFNKRRQSRDREVIADIIRTVENGELIVSHYSAPLFDGYYVRVEDEPLNATGDTSYCFVECADIKKHLNGIDTLIIYNWNRDYPSDKKLDVIPEKCGFKLTGKYEFKGKSHDKITKEIYKK